MSDGTWQCSLTVAARCCRFCGQPVPSARKIPNQVIQSRPFTVTSTATGRSFTIGASLMLSRYTIYRKRPKDAGPLPEGMRKDTRYRTSHILRPTEEIVKAYLGDPTDAAWHTFKREYLALLSERFRDDRTQFDELAELAMKNDVFLGCSCPTKKNPIPERCHTYLALEFMYKKYPELDVVIPDTSSED